MWTRKCHIFLALLAIHKLVQIWIDQSWSIFATSLLNFPLVSSSNLPGHNILPFMRIPVIHTGLLTTGLPGGRNNMRGGNGYFPLLYWNSLFCIQQIANSKSVKRTRKCDLFLVISSRCHISSPGALSLYLPFFNINQWTFLQHQVYGICFVIVWN